MARKPRWDVEAGEEKPATEKETRRDETRRDDRPPLERKRTKYLEVGIHCTIVLPGTIQPNPTSVMKGKNLLLRTHTEMDSQETLQTHHLLG